MPWVMIHDRFPGAVNPTLGPAEIWQVVRGLLAGELRNDILPGLTAHPEQMGRYTTVRLDGLVVARFGESSGPRTKIPRGVRRAVVERDGMVCGLCGQPIGAPSDLHIDHITPVAHGGDNHPANLQPAHAACNVAKGANLQ